MRRGRGSKANVLKELSCSTITIREVFARSHEPGNPLTSSKLVSIFSWLNDVSRAFKLSIKETFSSNTDPSVFSASLPETKTMKNLARIWISNWHITDANWLSTLNDRQWFLDKIGHSIVGKEKQVRKRGWTCSRADHPGCLNNNVLSF